jgi:hypothetical protein
MHPLTPDLSGLKDDELQKKVAELSRKLNQAYSFGQVALVGQIQLVLSDYYAEQARRQQKMMDELMSKSGQFDKIIDIK